MNFVDKNGKKMSQKEIDKAIDKAILKACNNDMTKVNRFANAIQKAEEKRKGGK